MSALAIGAGAALLGTGFQVYQGIKQESKANQLEKSLQQPQYAIPQEFYQNREIARQLAQVGLPSATYNNQFNQIAGNEATAIAAAQRSNNPAGAIGNIVSGTNAATSNLNAEDAQARQSNQRLFMQANDQIAGQKLQQQQANVFDPYTQHYNEMQAYRGAGLQNLNSAFQGVGQLGGLALQYGLGNGNIPNQGWANPQAGQPPLTAQGVGIPQQQFNQAIPTQPLYTNWKLWE